MTAPNQPPSGSSSALKVLGIIFLVLLLLGIVLVGSCVYCVASNPEVRKVGSVMSEMMRLGMEADKAPGAAELRAAGCQDAMVMDMRPLLEKVDALERSGGQANFRRPEEEWQKTSVFCGFESDATLDCAAVAKTYGAAVEGPPHEFGVAVKVMHSTEPVCQGVYRPDGTLVKEIEGPVGLEPVPIAPTPFAEDLPAEESEAL
jgi:hypothetical protein